MPEQIKLWVDLLTWQVLALLAGIALLPAIYIAVFTLQSLKIGNVEITRKEAKDIAQDSETAAEDNSKEEADAEIDNALKESPDDPLEKLANITTLWDNFRVLVKDKASTALTDGKGDLRADVENLQKLSDNYPAKLSKKDVEWARDLKQKIKSYTEAPKSLGKSASHSFKLRVNKLRKRIATIPDLGDSRVASN